MNRNSPAMGDSECILVRKSGGNEEWNRCCYSGLSGSPPSCAPVDFVVPGLDGLHFVVWGTEEGLVQVGYYEVGCACLSCVWDGGDQSSGACAEYE